MPGVNLTQNHTFVAVKTSNVVVLNERRNRLSAIILAALMLPATLAVSACSSSSPPAPAGASDVVARIGDRNITMADLDKEWRSTDAAEHAEASFKLYDGRRKALNEIIAKQLLAGVP